MVFVLRLALALRAEELLEERGALLGQKASLHLAAVVQPRVPGDVSERPAKAGLRVRRSEDDPGDPGVPA